MKTLLKLSVFATMLILIAISCQKDLSFENDVNKEFNTAFVKKWYNNSFIKSAEFTTHNQKENGKKQPDWKNGKYRKVGNMEIIDFPLLKEKKTISVRSDNSLTSADKKRIAKASLKRISFIKTANNEIVVRELDYVPEWEYLKAKNFDISDVELGNPNNTFTGRIITKKWSGEVLSVRLLTEGKITGRLISKQKASAITKSKSLKTPGNNLWECGPVEYCDETEMCEMEWVCTGDYCAYQFVVPNNCYWVEDCWTEEECEWVEEEPVCDYGLSESCECQLYGLNCNGNGGGGGSTNEAFDNSIVDSLSPCRDIILTGIKNLATGQIANIIHHFTGNVPGFNWKIIENSTTSDPNANATTQDHPSQGFVLTTLNTTNLANATDLFVARTIMHEAIHAYLVAYFYNDPNTAILTYPELYDYYVLQLYPDINDPHHAIIANNLVNDISMALKNFALAKGYTNNANLREVCDNLAWGGLYGTNAFANLPINQKIDIDERNTAEKTSQNYNGTTLLGTKACP